MEDSIPVQDVAPRLLLRRVGPEFEAACERCRIDLDKETHFDAKFAVLDTWMRGVDEEPGFATVIVQNNPVEVEGACEPEKNENLDGSEKEKPAAESGSPQKTEQEVEGSRPKFAKYKRLKEALMAYEEMHSRSAFAALVPVILRLAAAACHDSDLTKLQVPSEPVSSVRLAAGQVRMLLANTLLLNVRTHRELQSLYLSSAKAAPQKLLCLLALFDTDHCADEGRELSFERFLCPEGQCPSMEQAAGEARSYPFAPTVEFHGSYAAATQRSQSLVIALSAADTFGKVFDVKTPPEEVVLWEFPELLAVRLLLGPFPLEASEVYAVRGIRHINSCSVDGPLLHLGAAVAVTEPILNIMALDISRSIGDLQFSLDSLAHDCRKWVAAFSALGCAAGALAVSHPPLLGVNHHRAFVVQSMASACAANCMENGSLTLNYSLGEDYSTAEDVELLKPEKGADVAEMPLSQKQQKEAKHFGALTNRMKLQGWKASEVIGLLAVYPFARDAPTQPFHAFWTARLRASTGGRPSAEELAEAGRRQEELQPAPCKKPADEEERARSRSPSHHSRSSHQKHETSRMRGWEESPSWHSNHSWQWWRREWHSDTYWAKHAPNEGSNRWHNKDAQA